MRLGNASELLRHEISSYIKFKEVYSKDITEFPFPLGEEKDNLVTMLSIEMINFLQNIRMYAELPENSAWVAENISAFNTEIDFVCGQVKKLCGEQISSEMIDLLDYFQVYRLADKSCGCDLILTDDEPVKKNMNNLPFQVGYGYVRVKSSENNKLLDADPSKTLLKEHCDSKGDKVSDEKLQEFDEMVGIKALENFIKADQAKQSSNLPKKCYPKPGHYPIGRVLSLAEVGEIKSLLGYAFASPRITTTVVVPGDNPGVADDNLGEVDDNPVIGNNPDIASISLWSRGVTTFFSVLTGIRDSLVQTISNVRLALLNLFQG